MLYRSSQNVIEFLLSYPLFNLMKIHPQRYEQQTDQQTKAETQPPRQR